MVVIGLGIPVMVLYFQYKKLQTAGKRKAILVLNILLTIFTALSVLGVISSIASIGILSSDSFSDLFSQMFSQIEKAEGFDSGTFSEISSSTMSIVSGVMLVTIIINIVTIVYGIVCMVLGYKALANKTWTAAAFANTNVKNAQGAYAQSMPKTCTVCGNAVAYTALNCPRCGSASFAYPQQNAYQQPVNGYQPQNPIPPQVPNNAPQAAAPAYQQADAPQYEWYCSCGTANSANAKFCSNCGKGNPNI